MAWVKCNACKQTVKAEIISFPVAASYVFSARCPKCGALTAPRPYGSEAIRALGTPLTGGEDDNGNFIRSYQ